MFLVLDVGSKMLKCITAGRKHFRAWEGCERSDRKLWIDQTDFSLGLKGTVCCHSISSSHCETVACEHSEYLTLFLILWATSALWLWVLFSRLPAVTLILCHDFFSWIASNCNLRLLYCTVFSSSE